MYSTEGTTPLKEKMHTRIDEVPFKVIRVFSFFRTEHRPVLHEMAFACASAGRSMPVAFFCKACLLLFQYSTSLLTGIGNWASGSMQFGLGSDADI